MSVRTLWEMWRWQPAGTEHRVGGLFAVERDRLTGDIRRRRVGLVEDGDGE